MALGAATKKKNSGILRYTFSDDSEGLPAPFAPALVGGAAATVITCLGADAEVNPDQDDQVFGASPGHIGIPDVAPFVGLATARGADPISPRSVDDPATIGRIPAGTKVTAQFLPVGASAGGAGSSYASFYVTPANTIIAIANDTAVDFDAAGPTSGGGIVRSGAGTYILPTVGTYDVSWQVPISTPNQFMVRLNGAVQTRTLAGQDTGTSLNTNRVLITTVAPNAVLEIVNHTSSGAAAIPARPGGTSDHAASLVIVNLSGGAGGTTGFVTTRVTQGPVVGGSPLAVEDPDGPQFLSTIQVALTPVGSGRVAGTLIVRVELSDDDIPGLLTGQDQNATAT